MADITIDEITSGYLDGNGIFDTLMSAVQSRLDEQYELDRLKGSDYATVYVGAVQYAMAQAIQFSLQKQQADKQAELIQAQIDEIALESARKDALNTVQIAATNQQILESQTKLVLETNLNEANINSINEDINLKVVQQSLVGQQINESVAKVTRDDSLATSTIANQSADIDVKVKQLDVLTQQIAESVSKVARDDNLATATIANQTADTNVKTKQLDVLGQQISESVAKVTRDDAISVATIANQVADTDVKIKQLSVLDQQITDSQAKIVRDDNLANSEISLKAKQETKIDAEVDLIAAKEASEEAQVKDTVNGSSVAGVLGKQKALYQKQTDGFDRDAEQKALKSLTDLWSITMTAAPSDTRKPRWLLLDGSDTEFGQLCDALEKGVNNAFGSNEFT